MMKDETSYDELNVSKETDELICERVFKWKRTAWTQMTIASPTLAGFPIDSFEYDQPSFHTANGWETDTGGKITTPFFSRDLNQAEWILKRMTARPDISGIYRLIQYKDGVYGPHWCEFCISGSNMSSHTKWASARADTIALAICRAALKAEHILEKNN